jgi:hypothetical protein
MRDVEDTGFQFNEELLEFSRITYLAFRLGHARLGAELSTGNEVARLDARGDRYAVELQLLLERSSAATRLESSLG